MQSVRVRLAVFALVLAGAFGIGYTAGSVLPGGGPEPSAPHHTDSGHSDTGHSMGQPAAEHSTRSETTP